MSQNATPNESIRAAAPAVQAAATQVIAAGGNGKDGVLNITAAEGTPLVQTSRGSVGINGALTHMTMQLGGGAVAGVLSVFDREGRASVRLNGSNGSVSLSSQLAISGRDNADQFILGARSDSSSMFIGSPGRPAQIHLSTGGNPGSTIEIDGERNAMLFLNKGSRTDSVLTLDGNNAAVVVGSSGKNGKVSVRGSDGKPLVELDGNSAAVVVGSSGKNGTVSVRGHDGKPLIELLARSNESVIGCGQADRPGRISMFGAKGEAIRLDAATGDISLGNADCAEEFDVAVEGIEPGTVLVIGGDGRLVPCEQSYDARAAGVVSGAGTYRPALVLDRRDTGSPRQAVALMGKVYCFVDASVEPVATGDLLTTSTTMGHAMKATDRARAVGAVIGKALAPLASGKGLIPVLVSAR